MSAVSEWIVREYFEMFGYVVSQPCKYTVSARRKRPDEEIDLYVQNPAVETHAVPESGVWSRADLRGVARAVVAVRGWHTDRFYAGEFEHTPDLLRFVEPECINAAGRFFRGQPPAKILCLPRLPASRQLRRDTLAYLKEKGVDGILLFPLLLRELIGKVDRNCNYEKSDVLQVLRILKCYDMLKDTQLDLFESRFRKSPARERAPRKAGDAAAGEAKKAGAEDASQEG